MSVPPPAGSGSCALCAMTCLVEPAESREVPQGEPCPRGYGGHQQLQGADRLLQASTRGPSGRTPLDQDAALDMAARLLQGCMLRHGPHAVAVVCSTTLQLEAAWMIRQIALDGLNTTQVGCLGCILREGGRTDLDPLLGRTASTSCVEDIDQADVVLVVGADPARSHPQLAARIARAAERGAQVAVLHSNHTELALTAPTWIDPRRGTLNLYLAALLHGVRSHHSRPPGGIPEAVERSIRGALEGLDRGEAMKVCGTRLAPLEELSQRLIRAQRVVAVYDLDDTTERSRSDLALLACVLGCLGRLLEPGSGLLLLHSEADATGIAHADLYEELAPAVLDGRIRGMLVVGEDPLAHPRLAPKLRDLDTLVVLDAHTSLSTERSDISLPCPSLAESEGLLVRCDGRLVSLRPSAEPAAGHSLLSILRGLGERLGIEGLPEGLEATRQELSLELGRDAGHLDRLLARGERWEWSPVLREQPLELDPTPGCWPTLPTSRSRLQRLLAEQRSRSGDEESS